jgi:hypothetical protein
MDENNPIYRPGQLARRNGSGGTNGPYVIPWPLLSIARAESTTEPILNTRSGVKILGVNPREMLQAHYVKPSCPSGEPAQITDPANYH